jgi:N-acetyl sugar amidotransferase
MRYCTRCILPDTRPGIVLDADGVCTACHGHRDKETRIDWAARAKAFDELVAETKARSQGYDCIVPVSGGKDSWYQIIKAKEHGLTVLAVTWRTPARTVVGQRNLDLMIRNLGVDHIDYTIDPDVERRFMRAAFEERGTTGLPMHMALFAIPIRLAIRLRIPLILWGENPQLEYGGSEMERLTETLDADWLSRHGCLESTDADFWVGHQGLTEADLLAYRIPSAPDFQVRSVFLGAFFKWNSFENARIAQEHGFEFAEQDLKTGSWDFADIDCDFISLHHFLKWYKFGFTRTFDNLSVQIRYGMITREEAAAEVARRGVEPRLDDICAFCAFQGEPEAWFWQTAEGFRNSDVWVHRDGVWQIPGFLIPDWDWSGERR